MPLTIAQVRDDLLSKLGITDANDATDLTLQDVVVAVNGAMQYLQTAGQDYFTRELLTVTLGAGTAVYLIPASIQAVIGPIRWNDTKPLRALTSEGEYDEFSRIFLGGTAYGVGNNGTPKAYFVKYIRDDSSDGEICAIQIKMAPAPSVAGTIVVEVVNDAPAYVVADLDEDDAVPVAQNYTESIFLPIARMLVTRSQQFSRPDLLAQLTEDGERALALLGASGGFPNATLPGVKREVQA